jgi:hypothetical protein
MKWLTFLFLISNSAWSDADHYGLQVDVKREGRVYAYTASFNSSLTKCNAYQYLIDYESKKALPGVVDISVHRQSPFKAKVEVTADEPVLFFDVRIKSVLEYTEKPFEGVSFMQLSGNSIMFQGKWDIKPNSGGTRIRFKGVWEPDTIVPLVILDQFANQVITDKFIAIAELAEKYKGLRPAACID